MTSSKRRRSSIAFLVAVAAAVLGFGPEGARDAEAIDRAAIQTDMSALGRSAAAGHGAGLPCETASSGTTLPLTHKSAVWKSQGESTSPGVLVWCARSDAIISFVVAPGAVLRDRQLDRIQQILVANGFGQKLDRTRLHGPDRHRNIGVAADEDDRQAETCLCYLFLKIEPAAPGQSDIENQATREVRQGAIQEFLDANTWTRSPTARSSPRSAARISGSSSMTTTTD